MWTILATPAKFFMLSLVLVASVAGADEGMWLFNRLPKERLKKDHDFEVTPKWSRHIMRSSVRFNSGGSASFISPQGLVITNHHVASETLHKLSTARANYAKEGFYAKTSADEIKAPDLELNQLLSIEDVTKQVTAAVKPSMSAQQAGQARRAAMARIEQESLSKTGLRSDVVTLYGGSRFHLYRYKKYTDVRLVWAPDSAAAYFGGDPDNFEYPRYCLDVTIFRVYEDGKAADTSQHYLRVSQQGVAANDLIFVSGNPGRTRRIHTVAALNYQRDYRMPYVLDFLRRREVLYQQFGFEGEEQKRRIQDDLFGIQNSRKAYTGMLQGLQSPSLMASKKQEEAELRQAVASRPEISKYGGAWDKIAEVNKKRAEMQGVTATFASRYYSIAEKLVLMAIEDQKPSEQRLREFRDSARKSLEQQLFSPAPIYNDVAQVQLADSMSLFAERRGGNNELVVKALAGMSPQARAADMIRKTRLGDPAERKRLAAGKLDILKAARDPFIRLALEMEPEYRRIRKVQDELDETERQAYAQLADARFAVKGTSVYPDATFTLRLSYGVVKGYPEGGRQVKPFTTIAGAFVHEANHGRKDPWQMSAKWHKNKGKLKPSTPFNFVSTADIIGGNSGSPVVNRKGELVGVIFDGNIQSLTGDYVYTEEQARATSVDIRVVRESMRNVYAAKRVYEEIWGK